MRNPKMTMKQDFIKKWTLALKKCCKNSTRYMSIAEKQKVIKQSATFALAATKQGSTAWSRAILADHEHDQESCDNFLIVAAHGPPYPVNPKHVLVKPAYSNSIFKRKLSRSKRVRGTKRSLLTNRKASYVAKSIIKKQTQVLKKLIPGGETINESCLIGEALDYIVSLKAQVDVMKELVTAAEYVKKLYPQHL